MRIERGELQELHAQPDSVLTLGSFDGLHLAHQALIRRVVERAAASGLEAGLLTFEPHPRDVLGDSHLPVSRLMSPVEKLRMLEELGLERVILLRFTPELATWDAGRFLREGLLGHVGLRHLVVGHNHGFGRDRGGNRLTLSSASRELGFGLEVLAPVLVDGEPVSSTRVRRALLDGRVEEANALLGRPFRITGPVVAGEGRGRSLGVPTANLQLESGLLQPADGVYAVRATLEDGRRFPGMMNLGARPTFGETERRPEIHLFNLAEDLYGQSLRVDLLAFVRHTMRFNSGEQLATQLQEDRKRIQERLERDASPAGLDDKESSHG